MHTNTQGDDCGDVLESEHLEEVYSKRGRPLRGAEYIYKTNVRVPAHTEQITHRSNKLAFPSEGKCLVSSSERRGGGLEALR